MGTHCVKVCKRTMKKCHQEGIRSVDFCVDFAVKVLQRAEGIRHSQGVVDEQCIVVLSEVKSTLRPYSVVLFHS